MVVELELWLSVSVSVFMSSQYMYNCFLLMCVADLELGLKREALGAVDGSSLEALLKGEPLDRRSGVTEVRPEDDQATVEPPATSTTTHTSSGRIRKVWLSCFLPVQLISRAVKHALMKGIPLGQWLWFPRQDRFPLPIFSDLF